MSLSGSVLFVSYLRRHIPFIIALALIVGLFALVFYLYSLPPEPVWYAALLSFICLLIIAAIRFPAYCRRCRLLHDNLRHIGAEPAALPPPADRVEEEYQHIIRLLEEDRAAILSANDRAQSDMADYYTLWVHQIKTPIAAMSLLLQSAPLKVGDMKEQLFRVEQYVEMVLQYLRIESISADLIPAQYALDDIIRGALRKYAKSFINSGLALEYQPVEETVLTDGKWLQFVLEQILSNALKYTPAGRIRIYMDPAQRQTLVIEDSGIGISPEDLPRVFEKGFTGYNGHMDRRSTGIGLYLCKRILKKLNHTIEIRSEINGGTQVILNLYQDRILPE